MGIEEQLEKLRELEDAKSLKLAAQVAAAVDAIDSKQLKLAAELAKAAALAQEAAKEAYTIPTLYDPAPVAPRFDPPSAAEVIYEQLKAEIEHFMTTLRPGHEVGATLTSFGGMAIHVTELDYRPPGMIVLYGVLDDGREVTLAQHVSQCSILLVPVPVKTGEHPRRVGFHASR